MVASGSLVAYIRQIERTLSGNCTDDRVQTVYQNMYNYAYDEPAITSKYMTNKTPARELPTRASGYSAPYTWKKIRDKQKAAEAETLVAKAETKPTIPFDDVVGRMAMNAGKYRASAEHCLGKSMPEIEADFIAAVSELCPDRIAEVEAAYAGHYTKRQSNLAKKKKCQKKPYNTQKRNYEYNLSLLAPGTSG